MASLLPGISIHTTLGAVFVGFSVSCCVYGILLTQMFGYFWRYPLDKPMYKIIVIVIGLLETIDQVFIGHIVYWYGVSNYSNPLVLLEGTTKWSFILQLTAGAVVGTIVKASFGIRVWRFSGRNYIVTGLIMLLTFTQLSLATAYTIKAFHYPSVFAAAHYLRLLGTISLASGVLTDFITAGALCFYLNRLRTGYTSSDSLVNSLCRYAINTGVLTSAVSLGTLILYNVMPETNLYFIALYFVLSKLYAISYLATLNTRRTVRGRGTDREATTNNTNMFHLGTRVPSMGPVDINHWESGKFSNQEFPLNSFAPPSLRPKQPLSP